jgi:hypothetical protein
VLLIDFWMMATSRKVAADLPFPAVQQVFENVKAIKEVVRSEHVESNVKEAMIKLIK